jgi:hypothetical protein
LNEQQPSPAQRLSARTARQRCKTPGSVHVRRSLVLRRLHGCAEPVVVDGSAHQQQASREKPVAQVAAAVRKVGERFAGEGSGGFRPILRVDRDLGESPNEWIESRVVYEPFGGDQGLAVGAG